MSFGLVATWAARSQILRVPVDSSDVGLGEGDDAAEMDRDALDSEGQLRIGCLHHAVGVLRPTVEVALPTMLGGAGEAGGESHDDQRLAHSGQEQAEPEVVAEVAEQ